MKKWVVGAGVVAALAALWQVISGVFHWKRKSAMAFSVIGGADGPTSVFLAGKIPAGIYLGRAFIGAIILVVLVTAFVIWKRRNDK